MNTMTTKQQIEKYLLSALFIFIISVFTTSVYAQETVNVSGVVKSEIEPLGDVSIYVKGSKSGTVSKSNGSFKFPTPIRVGDKLVFSCLGFTTKEVTITAASANIEVIMEEAPIEVLSTPNSNTPYRSKRKSTN